MKSKQGAVVVSISDIHLGHHTTTTGEILANLRAAFPDHPSTGLIDLIIVGGDLFDRLLHLDDPQVFDIKLWMNQFLRLCLKYKIALRVLEGTRSHDWAQNRLFVAENQDAQIGADLEYIDTLSITYETSIERSVLWVPDDWRPDNDQTWAEVMHLISERGGAPVDLAMVHGTFEHQLPEQAKAPIHRLERYLSITTDYVLGGHIHKASTRDRFLCNGSFDRLTHGEEDPKGYWRLLLNRRLGNTATFVENPGAKQYRTIDCTGMGTDDALVLIASELKSLPKDSYIRIRAGVNDPILSGMDQLRKNYPTYTWATKVDDRKDIQATLLVDMRASFQAIQITRSNVAQLLMERVTRLTEDPVLLQDCQRLLNERLQ
jgi:hypothetical protein